MTGSATLTGRSSSAVGTTHDASKVTPCIVISLLAAKPPSPEVVHDKAPVPPGRVFLYDHIDPSWPRMFRIASCCQLPASRPAPSVHPRKRAGRGKNPFLFAMLFEKNIEIFSDPNPSVLCVFSICLPPFRAWVQGGSVQAGAWQEDTVREVYGSMSGRNSWIYVEGKGALATTGSTDYFLAQISPGGDGVFSGFDFRLSRSIPTGPITAPPHVWQPVILYLGEKA